MQDNIPFNKDLKTVLFILRDTGGCGFYRCLQPALFLRRRGLMNAMTDVRNATPEQILKADIVVLQSPGTTIAVDIMNFALKNNKKVVVEIDDFLHSVSPTNPGYEAWSPEKLSLHRFVKCLTKAHAVTVSTPQLAREYSLFNKNIYVLPNYLDESKWDLPVQKQNDGVTRIGWAGSSSHLDDLKMIAPVVEKIVKEYDGKVKFETMGLLKEELQDTFKLSQFFEICPKCNYHGDILTWAGEQLENYPQVMASHGWDIAIAPLINTAFNNARSDLKLKEYSAISCPIVASDCTPYRESKESGCDVLLAKNFEEWYNNLKKLISSVELRDEMVENNKKWLEKNWIDENVSKYSEIYNKLLNN